VRVLQQRRPVGEGIVAEDRHRKLIATGDHRRRRRRASTCVLLRRDSTHAPRYPRAITDDHSRRLERLHMIQRIRSCALITSVGRAQNCVRAQLRCGPTVGLNQLHGQTGGGNNLSRAWPSSARAQDIEWPPELRLPAPVQRDHMRAVGSQPHRGSVACQFAVDDTVQAATTQGTRLR
jgi:hypothetical protein